MDLKLEGKRALITGSSSGIGEAIARALARSGALVVVHGRNSDRARRVADGINDGGKKKAAVAIGDLALQEGADRVARASVDAWGGVDILINNAGGSDDGMKPWLETSVEQWQAAFEQNVFSAVRLIKALVPGMKKQGWGRVLQIASGVASQPFPVGADYASAKAAMVNSTVSLAKDLAGSGVTVNTISPGPISTPAAERVFRDIAKQRGWKGDRAEIEKQAVREFVPNPVCRMGTSEEVASAVAFLASPLADFINGANLRVDGGYVTAIN